MSVDWKTVPEEIYDVIVIGCGAAGIAAMSRLYQDGLNVIGLEGSNRVGGRIHSVEEEGSMIDLGAQWCHGEIGNIVYKMAKDYLGRPKDFNLKFVNSNRTFVESDVAMNFVPLYYEIHNRIASEMVNSNNSLGYHCNKAFWQYVNEEYPNSDVETNKQLNHWFQQFENSINASDTWFDASGKGHLEYHDCEGELLLHWQGRGFQTILDILTNKFPNPEKGLPLNVLLNKEVTLIDWTADNAVGVKVLCSDGSKYCAKHAIVTLSLGVLQERQLRLFYPDLPADKLNSINGLKLGTVNKMFLVFDEPWWGDEQAWYGLLWRDEDKKRFGPSWLQEVFAFNTCEHNPNVLCGWIVGNAARYVETLDDEVVEAGLFQLLVHFFGKVFTLTSPKKLVRSQWYSDKFTRGSYSFRSIESDVMRAWASDLAAPLTDESNSPVVCFAGEATSTHYFSTVHGAIESGFREADRIIATKKTNIECKVVIVGAGIAGIMAASRLVRAGLREMVLLESEDRIGGRIHSIKVKGHFLEYGAQWLHGEENELKRISEEFDLLSDIESFEGEGKFFADDGMEYDCNLVEAVGTVIFEILRDCEELKNDPTVNYSVGEYLTANFDLYVTQNIRCEEIARMWREIAKWYIKFYEIDNSCDTLYDLSAKCWGLYDFNGEENQRHINYKRGYLSVLNKIMRTIPKTSVHLNTRVDKIDWKRSDQERVIVHTKYHRYVCEHVIVTASLGVLKDKYKTMFYPELPLEYESAIKHIGFSGFGKIFLQFAEPWWDDDKGFQFVWAGKQRRLLRRLKKKDALWLQFVTGFDVVSVGPPNCLIAWVASKGAKIMEQFSEQKIKKDCNLLFKTFLRHRNLPKICMVKRTTWLSNPSFNGCYSHLTLESDLHNVGPASLAKPITNDANKPVLMFAGEAVHEKYFSTTHGAAESGARQAEVILDYNDN